MDSGTACPLQVRTDYSIVEGKSVSSMKCLLERQAES